MKILILGAKGMLGTDLVEVFSDGYDILAQDIEDIDITDRDKVERIVNLEKPQLVINAAAYTDVDGAEDNEELANKVNGEAPGMLAGICKNNLIPLIHYSTDYVFKGDKEVGYNEDETVNPVNAYGRSKVMGEKNIINNTSDFYIIRTQWLYGKNGKNFIDTILKKAEESDSIEVVNDQFGKPTWTYDLAQGTRELFESRRPFGIYHLVNENKTSWFDFARELIKRSGQKVKVKPVATKDYAMKANRPRFSILNNTKTDSLRSWQEALKDYFKKL
ncbi:MAG: dTDP-4-dehydrorhamnose reductase [bacterium]